MAPFTKSPLTILGITDSANGKVTRTPNDRVNACPLSWS